jgi:hypothetical protein
MAVLRKVLELLKNGKSAKGGDNFSPLPRAVSTSAVNIVFYFEL